MARNKELRYYGYLFTFKEKKWREFEKFRKKWSADHSVTEKWSSGSSKSIPKGAPIFVMKQGKGQTGIFAAGFTESSCPKNASWPFNKLRFTQFLNPGEDKLLNIRDLDRKYWAARGSGVGLPTEVFHNIQNRWKALLGDNAREKKEDQKSSALDTSNADVHYEITNQDTRATALKQIKLRQGQGAFRQRCSIPIATNVRFPALAWRTCSKRLTSNLISARMTTTSETVFCFEPTFIRSLIYF